MPFFSTKKKKKCQQHMRKDSSYHLSHLEEKSYKRKINLEDDLKKRKRKKKERGCLNLIIYVL